MKNEAENGTDFELQEIEKNKTPVKNKSLFNIQEDFNGLMRTIEDAEGEITPEMEKALEINEKDLQKKSIGYLEIMKQKEGRVLMYDNEIKRLQSLKKTEENSIDRLKNSLLNAVKMFGEFTSGTVTFKTRKSSSLIIENEDLIPEIYKTEVTIIKIDKARIKSDLKTGKVVSAYLQENENLMIK